MKKNKKIFFILVLVLFISIGYAFLTSNLSLEGLAIIKKSKWDVHFENLVDDNIGSSLNIPAIISDDKLSVNFEVTLNNPGDEYYFYVDVVNNSTFDVMLKDYLVTGLTTEQEGYISTSITYSDEIEINKTNNKYDLLEENTKDTFKILVKYRDDIELTDIPEEEIDFSLTFNTTYEQADENAKERVHNTDVTGPSIKFINKNEVKGNNNWYKSLSVTTKLLDSSPIKSVKYCVTTDDNCTPNTPAEIENNSFTYQLLNDASIQTICIEATDVYENNTVKCSTDEYLVDGVDPVIDSITVTPDDNTVLVEVVGNDELSGVSLYHYSKDGGVTYVESSESNYTFTSLEDGEYIFTAYIEDTAGNTSETKAASTTVRHKDWCEKNGITDLGECAIATETQNPDVAAAKSAIEAKGNPDFTKISPQITYTAKVSEEETEKYFFWLDYYIGTDFEIDSSTGKTKLKNYTKMTLDSGNYEDNNYYMCGDPNRYDCGDVLYKIVSLDVVNLENGNIRTSVLKKDLIPQAVSYDSSDVGMYSMDDDMGKSYYYRGSVGSNYVKFAEHYWRIVRVNGDGSLRLIYYGDNPTTGSVAFTSQFNKTQKDLTYVGFMHNESGFSKELLTSGVFNFSNFQSDFNIYFGKEYSYDSHNKKFHLTGSLEDGNLFVGSWKDNYQNLLENDYIYTCISSDKNGLCQNLFKIAGNDGENVMKVQAIYYGSTSYENAIKNVDNSIVLNSLNNWYNVNLSSVGDLLKDQIYCNDRSILENDGDGYSLDKETRYAGNRRMDRDKNPTLICPNNNDKFSTTEAIGNGALENPIGMITADEVALAGGLYNNINILYYLNYGNNISYWTMTPASLNVGMNDCYNLTFKDNGSIKALWFSAEAGVLPVINLDTTKISFTGTGTKEDPYVVSRK